MILSELFVSFILYSFLGWVWETIYCTVREKRFQNRGFLFGPVCPIYGSCIVFVQLMCRFGQGLVDEKAPVWRPDAASTFLRTRTSLTFPPGPM